MEENFATEQEIKIRSRSLSGVCKAEKSEDEVVGLSVGQRKGH